MVEASIRPRALSEVVRRSKPVISVRPAEYVVTTYRQRTPVFVVRYGTNSAVVRV